MRMKTKKKILTTVNSQVVIELNDDSVMKLKVAKLRELAVELGLGSEDSMKKIKKQHCKK